MTKNLSNKVWPPISLALLLFLSGCGGSNSLTQASEESESVCTTFRPWIKKVEKEASVIDFAPNTKIFGFKLFGLKEDLEDAGYEVGDDLGYDQTIEAFLDVAGECLSLNATVLLENSFSIRYDN